MYISDDLQSGKNMRVMDRPTTEKTENLPAERRLTLMPCLRHGVLALLKAKFVKAEALRAVGALWYHPLRHQDMATKPQRIGAEPDVRVQYCRSISSHLSPASPAL